MPGVMPLSGLQIGVESTAGTAVATTRELYPDGTGYIDPGYQKSFHEGAQRGTFSNITYASKTGEAPALSFRSEPSRGLAFDELVIPGSQLIGAQTGAGTGADKTWTFTPAQTSHTFDTYTLNAFDGTQAYELDYCFATGFNLSWGFDDLTQWSMDLVGQGISKVTADSVAGNDAVTIASALWTTKYATAQSGLTGASALGNTVRSVSLDVDTGLRPRFYADGAYGFGQGVASMNLGGTLQMTWDSSSDAVTQYDRYVSDSVSFFRFAATGPSLGGSAYSAQIDVAVLWEDVEPIGSESDGVSEYLMTGRLVYDSAWSNSIEMTVVNSIAALP